MVPRADAPGPAPPPAATLVGLLADEARLRCLAAVVLGASTVAEVAAAAGLDARGAVRALERLAGAGLVVRGPGGLRVEARVLADAARAAAEARPQVRLEEAGATPEQARVLRNFLTPEGRLGVIPAARGKRRVVLDHVAGRFEPGRVYPERDVNRLLATLHPDHAALRRYLVDEGFLERREGFYWRAGGTFEVD